MLHSSIKHRESVSQYFHSLELKENTKDTYPSSWPNDKGMVSRVCVDPKGFDQRNLCVQAREPILDGFTWIRGGILILCLFR